MEINIFYNAEIPKSRRRSGLFRAAVKAALGRFSKLCGEVNVIFVSPEEIRRVNKIFLKHDYVTDVISFNYPFDRKTGGPFGDIFICAETAEKNARLYRQSVFEETLTYAVHGALHLTGMEDRTRALRADMDERTAKIIKKILA